MFTGLIEQQGIVIANTKGDVAHRLYIRAQFDKLLVGESIAVNGVCLTLLADNTHESCIAFDVSPETLSLTNLGWLQVGDKVNLERAMLASARFGGHYVNGHVDATAMLQSVTEVGEYVEMQIGDFSTPAALYLIPKGSVALDGVSLTINVVEQDSIKVLLIPHTLEHTTLGLRRIGERFNVEFDYLTQVVAHQLRLNYDKSL